MVHEYNVSLYLFDSVSKEGQQSILVNLHKHGGNKDHLICLCEGLFGRFSNFSSSYLDVCWCNGGCFITGMDLLVLNGDIDESITEESITELSTSSLHPQ